MKKLSLLAASVAIALVGCGGSDDSPAPNAGGTTITGFDGYFKNALMFVDKNNDGRFNSADDQLLGLTNDKGQVNLKGSKPAGTLALQTLVLGQPAQQYLANLDSKYQGVFTVDMDHPSQPVEKELLFRAANASDVISPISDLVLIEMNKSTAENPITEKDAITTVQNALGLNADTNLYIDFVEGADANPELHKVAQILTESKAVNPAAYEANANNFATDAKQSVDAMTPEQKQDPSFKAPVNGDTSDVETPIYKTYVNEAVANEVQAKFDALTLQYGQRAETPVTLFSVNIAELFKDGDVSSIDTSKITLNTSNTSSVLDKSGSEIGLIAYIRDDQLHVGLNSTDAISKAGEFNLVVSLAPTDANLNPQSSLFNFKIATVNDVAPEVNPNIEQALQADIDAWELVKGKNLGEGYTLDPSSLFSSKNDQSFILSISSNASNNGLFFEEMNYGDGNIQIGLQGTPTRSAAEDSNKYTLLITATTKQGSATTVTLNLPDVKDAQAPGDDLDISSLEDKVLYYYEATEYATNHACFTYKLSDGYLYESRGEAGKSCSTSQPTQRGDQYKIIDNSLRPYYGKYTLADAKPRRLLSAITNQGATSYVINNGVNAAEVWNATEYFDSAETVNALIKERMSTESWDSRTLATTMFIAGEYKHAKITPAFTGSIANLFIELPESSITCNDIATYKYMRLRTSQSDYNSPVQGVCNDVTEGDVHSVKIVFAGISPDQGDKYTFTLKPEFDNDNVPKVLRFLTFDGDSPEKP